MLKKRSRHRHISRTILLVAALLILFGSSAFTEASVYSTLFIQSIVTVSSPEVILQNGSVGTSTIYTNSTSAKVSVEAPLFDYVDNNEPDVDSAVDKGGHSNFPAQQAGPDSTYDALVEENSEAIEDYVDNNSSDIDSSSDLGTHSNFENQKAQDSSYDTFTEVSQANTHSLDATGGYMIIGDGTPDWGSTTGTISFWVKMDGSVQGRLCGQDGNMETRWSGTNLVLDWGGTASMTSAYSFSADTWYFVAIVWDENNDNLFLYIGDENNAPILDANSISGTWTSTTPPPTENRFLNGLGAAQPVDGHGDDLRYWNIARSLAELQSDYNETLTGSETNLQSYFKLDNNFDDIGPNNDDGSGSGGYSFSTDIPFSGSSDYGLDLEIQWTSIIDFLPTEKLCIYTGALGSEDLRLDYWNGTGWENLATDLTAYSCNEYTISLTSANFTIRFKGGTESSDTTQDQWQIDASLLRVEGAGSNEDAVDNDTSNVDGSADIGILSNFDNMKTKDGMANLTEGDSGGGTVWLWQEDTSGYSATSSYEAFEFWNSWTTNSTTSGTITKIGIYVFANPGNSPQVKLGIYDDSGGSPNNLLGETNAATITAVGWLDIDIIGVGVNISASTTYHIAHITDIAPTTQWRYYKIATPVSDYRNLRVWPNLFDPAGSTTKSSSYRYGAYRVGYTIPCYELDQEVQWTDLQYSLPNEELCIYSGTVGTEDIKVDVWNGSSWVNIISDLNASAWNNVTVTSYLTSSNFTIRFKGGNETGDISQDTWQIDVALIHIWHDGGESFELDLEVQWTNADYARLNEELCIRTGTFSGSEDIQVKVWNSSSSSWHWVMNLTASQWNNVSIASYLTSSTLTVQFLGGEETGDVTQDSWNLDATLLHVWTQEWGTWSDELLVNPSFELGNLTGWTAKGPAAASVEVFNATSGGDIYTNRSLRIGVYGVCTLDSPGTNDDSGVWQNVSLASYASAIDSGNAVINATAWLYPSEWDWDDVALIVRFYNSSGGFISAWNTTGEYGSGSAYYPQAWMLGQGEAHFTQGQLEKFGCYNYTIPVGTRTVGLQLGMGEHKDTFYCGGQADEASIKVRTRTAWLSGWDKRVKLTINHNDIESDLSDFPVLVYLSNSSGRKSDDLAFIFDEVGANSKKIAVTESDGTTQCNVEIEKWNASSEQAWLWVKVPIIDGTAYTDLYLYYDNSQSDNTAYIGDKESTPAQNVWNTNFKAIWHLDEDPSGGAPQMKDSTQNNNDGTSYGNMTTGDQVAGKIDGGLDFDGSDDYIQTTSNELQTLDNFTLSVWFKADSTTAPQHILWQGPASQNGWGDGSGSPSSHEMHLTICKFDTNNTLNFFYGYEESGGNFTPAVEIITPFSDTTNWNHAVVVMTGASTSPSAELFLNGVSQGTDTGTQTNRTAWDTNLRIGRPGASQRYFDGRIDEVRILDTARSAAWVKATYESGRDDLLDFGASGTSEGTYNYVLRVNNTVADSWQIRLRKYSDSNFGRLQNCTIYFQNSSDGTSRQIYIQNGLYVNQTGPWYDLSSSETIYIVMKVATTSTGTSRIYAYLEIRIPSTTTYSQCIIEFEIT